MVHEHDAKAAQEQIADLVASVGNLNERCRHLKAMLDAAPKRRRPRKDPLGLNEKAA